MKSEKTITVGTVVDIIERLKQKERTYCDDFCKLNSGNANDERRRDCTLICSVLNTVLYELNALNYYGKQR